MTDNTPKDEQAEKEWADLQRDLDTLGQQLNSLRDHTSALGETLVANLETQFQDVRNRALGFRSATEAQVEEIRKTAVQQAMETQASLTEASKDTARQVWERSEPLRQGAQEVGKGFVRAWSEIATSFGKAAEKVQTQKDETPAGEEPHKSS
jgi:predicted  nucleic acid-binding Zn-ribbon protein